MENTNDIQGDPLKAKDQGTFHSRNQHKVLMSKVKVPHDQFTLAFQAGKAKNVSLS